MISQACTPEGCVSLAVTPTSAVGITSAVVTGTTTYVLPPGANLAMLVVEGTGSIRWRDDGTAPTPTQGMLMGSSQSPFAYSGSLAALQMISVSGTVPVDVAVYKVAG